MNLTFFDSAKRIFGLSKKWLLNHAEYWIYDLVGLPMALRRFFGGNKTTSAATNELHDFYARNFWRLPFGPLRGLLTIVLWPLALVIAVILFTLWNGVEIKQRHGVSILGQIIGQFKLAAQHSIAPFWFYMFELYDETRSKNAALYLMAHETIGPAFTLLQPVEGIDQLPEPNESQLGVLTVYIDDVTQKLGVFRDLRERIELFRELLNRRFHYKQVRIDKRQGLVFQTAAGQVLPPTALSTGEQHEVVVPGHRAE